MRRTSIATPLCGALMLMAAACGDDDDTSATSSSSVTTAASAPTTTSDTSGEALPTDPQAYALALIDAWEQGDADRVEQLATGTAAATITAYEPGGFDWPMDICDGAAGSTYCTFESGGDPSIIVRVSNEAASQGQEHAVSEIQIESP